MITTYDHIDANKRKTVLLLALFPVSLLFVLFVALYIAVWFFPELRVNNSSVLSQIIYSYWPIFLVCFLFSVFWMILSFSQGSKMLLNLVNASKADEDEFDTRQVQRILENVSIAAGIPTPKLYILRREEGLNAFAVGTQETNSAVVLTKGLIETLDNSELEAVIAHEVAHIVHKDTQLMMIIALVIGFATYFGYMIFRLTGGRSSRRNNGKGAGIILIIGLAFLIYGYLVAPLIRLAVSRTREFEADAKSALLTRNPQALISALRKIDKHPIVGIFNSKAGDNELMAPMCIGNPLRKRVSLFDALSNLSSTHPPIEKRIQALESMDGRDFFLY